MLECLILSIPAFLRSLKRFIARKGLPCKLLSNNGKTLKLEAKTIIREIVNSEEV